MNVFLENHFHTTYTSLFHCIMYPTYWGMAFLRLSISAKSELNNQERACLSGEYLLSGVCEHSTLFMQHDKGPNGRYLWACLPHWTMRPSSQELGPGWVILLPCAQLREDLETVWWTDLREPRDSGGKWKTAEFKVSLGWITSGKGIVTEVSWPGLHPRWQVPALPDL